MPPVDVRMLRLRLRIGRGARLTPTESASLPPQAGAPPMHSLPAKRGAGFTLVEVMFSVAILATASLILSAAVMSAERMNTIARERAIATNAVRSYVEAMRQYYPAAGSLDMTGFLRDVRTPVAFLPTDGVEAGVLHSVEAAVLKLRTETPVAGMSWDHVAATGNSTIPTTIAADDIAALTAPRDLNADGLVAASGQPAIAEDKVYLIPIKVEIRWSSGSGTAMSAQKQRLVIYAAFSPHH